MPFLKSAQSMRAKLHISEAKNATLIGVGIAVLVVIFLIVQGFLGMAKADEFEIAKQENVKQQDATSSEQGDIDTPPHPSVFVHVAGAVETPGLYELTEGARVQQAVDAAGGFAPGAATSLLNLARTLTDGEQVLVAFESDELASNGSDGSLGSAVGAGMAVGGGLGVGGKVNINNADVGALDSLPGIGPSTAEKIIADRKENGPFKAPEDLKRVTGIGDKKYAQLADKICVG